MEHLTTRLRRLLRLLREALEQQDDVQAITSADLRELMRSVGLADEELDELLALTATRAPVATREAWLTASMFDQASEAALRQMGANEDQLVTVAAFDYLLRLVRTGQITPEQMESLLQFAQLVPEGPLEPRDLTPLLDRVVFRDSEAGWAAESDHFGRAH